VIDVVAAQLRAAKAAGGTPAHLDPDTEAVSLLAMSAGLGQSVLGGQSSPGQAQAVIDYHLDRLFPASRPALRRASTKCRWCISPLNSAGSQHSSAGIRHARRNGQHLSRKPLCNDIFLASRMWHIRHRGFR
jgi:BetI-type transcriptional repressor, C-terminal